MLRSNDDGLAITAERPAPTFPCGRPDVDESFAAQIIDYHEASKHHYRTYAPSPGYLDWAAQPDPFRHYAGAQVIPLARTAPDDDLPYEAGFMP